MDSPIYDVIIVGAGISGMNSAYILKKRCKNIKILILEAKDRVGGRTLTIDLKCAKEGQKSKWDIGGQWVTHTQKNITKLLSDLNIPTYRQYDSGQKLLEANGKISIYNSSVPCSSFLSWFDMQLYMKRVGGWVSKLSTNDPYENCDIANKLDSQNLKDYLYSKSFTPTVRSIFNSNMRTIYGLELNQVNALFGLMYVKSSGGIEAITFSDEGCAQEKRVQGGTQQISQKCLDYVMSISNEDANSTELLFNTALIEVNQSDDLNGIVEITSQNTITGEKTVYRTRKLISSIPINQYVNVKFVPELPFYKRNFFKFCQVGNYIKFAVTYKTHFWRKKGLSGEGTYDGSVMWLNEERFAEAYKDKINDISFNKVMPTIGAVAEVFDGTNEENQPALLGFIAAKAAVEWADQSDGVRKAEVIEDLVRMYGEEARDYVDYVEKNWAYEPYNGGCPCFNVVTSGVMKDFARATREPFFNVHFCGTETATEWQGYMDGAAESGERVANEILCTLYKNDDSIEKDFTKTYYYQKNESEKIKQTDIESKKWFSLKNLTKQAVQWSIVLGFSYFLSKRFSLKGKFQLSSLF